MRGHGSGGVGTSGAALYSQGVVGGTPLRRTFAVGRLTRSSAEIQLARGSRWRGPFLLRAVTRSRPGFARVH